MTDRVLNEEPAPRDRNGETAADRYRRDVQSYYMIRFGPAYGGPFEPEPRQTNLEQLFGRDPYIEDLVAASDEATYPEATYPTPTIGDLARQVGRIAVTCGRIIRAIARRQP